MALNGVSVEKEIEREREDCTKFQLYTLIDIFFQYIQTKITHFNTYN